MHCIVKGFTSLATLSLTTPATGTTASATLIWAARLGVSRQFGAMLGRAVAITVPWISAR
jgi:hypothetical protein